MSLLVPIAAGGAVYALYKILRNRTDRHVDCMQAKNEKHAEGQQVPAMFKWISMADAINDKTNMVVNFTVHDAEMTADGRVRSDLMSRHGRAVAGLVGVQ